MSYPYLSVGHVERQLSNGDNEKLSFKPGVNLLVGPPNTGKTKWLQTLDYLLGDTGSNPFDGAEEEGLAEKYESARAELVIGAEQLWVERRWREAGGKTKIFVNGEGMATRDFQHYLMQKLGIPLLNFPKGNPMSGQTWPDLSFRMLLRHIYRQQRFWGGIADQQPDSEQHATLLQFLGLAQRLFSEEYGRLVKLKMDVERLKVRREHYGQTLDDLVREVMSEPDLSVGANTVTVSAAANRLAGEVEALHQNRAALIEGARDKVISLEYRGRVNEMVEERSVVLVRLEDLKYRLKAAEERSAEFVRYRSEIGDELDRIDRVEDAGLVLSDLKITHCPACDQEVTATDDREHCFLCHQSLPNEVLIKELGSVRLRFERERLAGDLGEILELLDVLRHDSTRLRSNIVEAEDRLQMLEMELAPARQLVAGLVQGDISAIDVELGQLSERQRQLSHVTTAIGVGQALSDQIASIEREIEPLEQYVAEMVRATDFETSVEALEGGMNAYLNELNVLRPDVWRHSEVSIDISRYSFSFKLGRRRWQASLGGTDTLYFLMAYHYGLLSLSDRAESHYPGLSIIDVPGEFSGEDVQDKENFIVQPFIDLLSRKEFRGGQLIITGASFAGLAGVNRLRLQDVYVA